MGRGAGTSGGGTEKVAEGFVGSAWLELGRVLGSAQIRAQTLLDLLPWRGRLEQILAKRCHIPSVHVASVLIPSQQLLHIPDPGNER